MKVAVRHKLSTNDARKRISKLIFMLKKEYKDNISNVTEKWTGNKNSFSFRMKGLKITGYILVQQNSVSVNGKLPFMAMPFRGMIEETIRKKAIELLR